MTGAERTLRRCEILIFLLLWGTYGYFYQSGYHNEVARFAQIRSFAENGIPYINEFAGRTADVVVNQGSILPNKAPGSTLVGLPPWLVLSPLLKWFGWGESTRYNVLCYLVGWLTVGLLTALTGVVLYLLSLHLFRRPSVALLAALGYGLGTIAFPFATVFFGHQIAAALLLWAFALIFAVSESTELVNTLPRVARGVSHYSRSALLVAGACLGLAVMTEYPAVLGAMMITVYAVAKLRDRRLCFVLAGGAVFGALLIGYNFLAFGRLWYVPYAAYLSSDSPFPDHQRGIMGVGWPSLEVLWEITFGAMRGLFVVNPWCVLGIPAAFLPLFQRTYRHELLTAVGVVVLFFAFNAGYGTSFVYWGGGASVGPRHVLPALPFLVLLIAALCRTRGLLWIAAPLFAVSVSIMLMATAVDPRAPYASSNPVPDFYWHNYLEGEFALPFDGIFSSDLMTTNSVAFNLGKLIGLPGAVQLLPLLVVWWLMLDLLFRTLPPSHGRTAARGACILVVTTLAVLPLCRPIWMEFVRPGTHALLQTTYLGTVWDSATGPAAEGAEVYSVEPSEQIILPHAPELTGGRGVSIEWRGFLYVPSSGTYLFATQSDDGSSVQVNGRLIVDNWGAHASTQREAAVELQEGFHSITVRYYDLGGGGSMYVFWATMGTPFQLIPSRYLYLEQVRGE